MFYGHNLYSYQEYVEMVYILPGNCGNYYNTYHENIEMVITRIGGNLEMHGYNCFQGNVENVYNSYQGNDYKDVNSVKMVQNNRSHIKKTLEVILKKH